MPFPTAENIWFFKLVTLIIDVGSVVVENKLTEKIRDSGLTFEVFLNRKKHELYHFYKPNTCCLCSSKLKSEKCQKSLSNIQWKTLFTKTKRKKCSFFKGNCSCVYDANTIVKEEELDITLSVYLLINFFPLFDCEKQDLERFREQRNTYYAHITRAKLEEHDFKYKFQQVSSVIKRIASSCKIITYSELCEEITDIENDFMQITPDDQKIINYIQEARELYTDVPQESVENVISTIHKGIKKNQKNQNENTEEKTKSGDLIDEMDKRTWQEEVEEILRDIKFKFPTVNGVSPKQRKRPRLIKKYDTFPSVFKCNDFKKVKSFHEPMKANETIDMKLCKTGSFEEIKNVLKSMTDRDQFLRDRDKEGFCAIHYASERRDEYTISVLRLLINYGADIADKTENGITVLHLACKNGNVALCKYCLSEDKSILNEEDYIGWNASLYAAFYEQMDTLTFLRENYQRLRIMSKRTLVNILHVACLIGNNDLYLHIKDTYPDIQRNADKKGRSLLQYAARGGNREILKDLLSKSEYPKRKLEIKNDDEIKTLHVACLYGHEEICRDIISQFPDTIYERDKDSLHAVHFATVGGHVPVVNLLMKFLKEKIYQLSISSPQNINILQMACVYRKTEMWKFIAHNFSNLLLEEDDNGWGMHHVAARCGNLEVLEIIVEKKYVRDLMSKDKLGRTVLHIASLYGNYNICKYLLSQFPNLVKKRDEDHCPACVLAARGGNEDAFYLLFEHSKSIISIKDKINMYYAASLSVNGKIIHFVEEQYRDIISRYRKRWRRKQRYRNCLCF